MGRLRREKIVIFVLFSRRLSGYETQPIRMDFTSEL